jgi:hypothetical protein
MFMIPRKIRNASPVTFSLRKTSSARGIVPAFKLQLRLIEALLAISFFLIGFFSGTGDDPAGRTRNAEPPARTG